MKRVLIGAAIGLFGLAALAYAGSRECAWIDTVFGLTGCTGRYTVEDLASVMSTIAVNRNGEIVIAGNRYGATERSGRFAVRSQIVVLDWTMRTEVRRLQPDFTGRPDQLQLSPSDDVIALTCRTSYSCDLADLPSGINQAGVTQIGLLDADGSVRWRRSVPGEAAQPSAEGRAFDLAFSADGDAVVAGPVAFSTSDGTPIDADPPMGASTDATLPRSYDIELAGRMRALDLPAGFVPFSRLHTTRSPDGSRLAALSRRFSGEGTIRAVLQIWDTGSGALLVRHEIATDLSPALAFDAGGQGVFVATASQPGEGASTQIRRYRAEAVR